MHAARWAEAQQRERAETSSRALVSMQKRRISFEGAMSGRAARVRVCGPNRLRSTINKKVGHAYVCVWELTSADS